METETKAERQKFRAGDIVRVDMGHGAQAHSETWVLACDEDRQGLVVAMGWPESFVNPSEVGMQLVEAASDEKRLETLRKVANSKGSAHGQNGRGPRASLALRQLEEMEPTNVGVTTRERRLLLQLENALAEAVRISKELAALRLTATEEKSDV